MLKTQQELMVQKRDGRVVSFESKLIHRAIEKAFAAERQVSDTEPLDDATNEKIGMIVENIVGQVGARSQADVDFDVEAIQDLVERELMRYEFFSVARRYILYRAEHTRMRQLNAEESMESDRPFPTIMVKHKDKLENFDLEKLQLQIIRACEGLEDSCDSQILINETKKQFFDGISPKEISRAMGRRCSQSHRS